MINKYLAVVVVLVSAAVGCAPEDMAGMGMAQTDAGAAVDTLPGVGGSTGGTVGTASDAGGGLGGAAGAPAGTGGQGQGGAVGGVTGTGGAHATGGMTGTAGAVGTGGTTTQPELFLCPSNTHDGVTSCGFLITTGQWEYLWKGDMACGNCTQNSKPITGCKTKSQPQTSSGPPPPEYILCVADCRAECCYKRVGATCTTDANCCSPMHCMDNGPGKNKSCR